MRLGIDVNRHKEIIVKAISALLLLLLRYFKLNHVYEVSYKYTAVHINTHTYTRLMALFPGLPRWAGTRKVKPIWILLKQETVSGSGISWQVCTSLQTDSHTSTPPLSFLQAGCSSCLPTNSVKTLKGCCTYQIIPKTYSYGAICRKHIRDTLWQWPNQLFNVYKIVLSVVYA